MSRGPTEFVVATPLPAAHRIASHLLLVVRWAAVAGGILATLFWADGLRAGRGWGGVLFLFRLGPLVFAGTLLLGVLPSALLWRRRRSALDRRNLVVTTAVCAVLAAEALIVFVVSLLGR